MSASGPAFVMAPPPPFSLQKWLTNPRVTARLHRIFVRINKVVSLIYTVVISSLILGVSYFYFAWLRGVVQALTPWYLNVPHTLLSLYLLFSIAMNYILCLITTPSGKPATSPESSEYDQNEDLEAGISGTVNIYDHNNSNKNRNNNINDNNSLTSSHTTANTTATSTTSIFTRNQCWRVCIDCEAPKPPRTHHCSTCNQCFVRMCHHCPALGRCIARDNYPYFFRFIWSAFVGCALLATTTSWLLSLVRNRTSVSAASPLRMNDTGTLFTLMACGVAVSISAGMLALWHAYLAGTAQTTIEWLENWRVRRRGDAPPQWGRLGGPFSRDVISNVRDSLGSPPRAWLPWWTVFLLPFPKDAQKLVGNGSS